MKTYYNKQGKLITCNQITRLDGRLELNPAALSSVELAQQCGLYNFEQIKVGQDETFTGKLVFDEDKGTCTHERRKLTNEEIETRKAAEEEALLRVEFEAELEAEKEKKFKEFKEKKAK